MAPQRKKITFYKSVTNRTKIINFQENFYLTARRIHYNIDFKKIKKKDRNGFGDFF